MVFALTLMSLTSSFSGMVLSSELSSGTTTGVYPDSTSPVWVRQSLVNPSPFIVIGAFLYSSPIVISIGCFSESAGYVATILALMKASTGDALVTSILIWGLRMSRLLSLSDRKSGMSLISTDVGSTSMVGLTVPVTVRRTALSTLVAVLRRIMANSPGRVSSFWISIWPSNSTSDSMSKCPGAYSPSPLLLPSSNLTTLITSVKPSSWPPWNSLSWVNSTVWSSSMRAYDIVSGSVIERNQRSLNFAFVPVLIDAMP